MWNLGRLLLIGVSAAVVVLLAVSNAAAFSSYISDIPNGAVNRCDNCHIDADNDDYEFTDFGDAFKGAQKTWTQSLADTDSDLDTFSNGWELQDSTGSWSTGQADPGVSSLVTLPGDVASIPPQILLDVLLLQHEEDQGANGSTFFTVDNSGGLVLDYSAADDQDWMSLDPLAGMLAAADPAEQVDVLFDTGALDPGPYTGTITVSATGVKNSPQTVDVELTVVPEPGVTALGLAALSTLALLTRLRRRA